MTYTDRGSTVIHKIKVLQAPRQLFLIKGDNMYERVELNLIELPTLKKFNILVQFGYFHVYAVLNTVTVAK